MQSTTVVRPDPEEQISTVVVDAIAEAEGVDPMDLTTRLYDVVDPDALDRLCRGDDAAPRPPAEVSFRFGSYRVTVDETRTVTIQDVNPDSPWTPSLGHAGSTD